jgi:hypothetical protein
VQRTVEGILRKIVFPGRLILEKRQDGHLKLVGELGILDLILQLEQFGKKPGSR